MSTLVGVGWAASGKCVEDRDELDGGAARSAIIELKAWMSPATPSGSATSVATLAGVGWAAAGGGT